MFFIVLDLRLTKVGVTAVTLFFVIIRMCIRMIIRMIIRMYPIAPRRGNEQLAQGDALG